MKRRETREEILRSNGYIMGIAYFVVGHYNLFNITGFLICLFTYIIFNIIWIFYLKSNKNEGQSSIE